jgi:hypothetical protein
VQQNLACGNDLLDSLDMAYNPVYLGLQGYSDARDQGNSIGASLIMGFDPAYGAISHGAAAVDDFNQGHYAAATGEASQSLLDTAATVGVATGLVGGYGAVAGAVRGAGAAEALTPLEQGAARVPEAWGPGLPNRDLGGTRWFDPAAPKANGIRIDEGVPGSPFPSQQVDHVIVRSGGRILGPDGKPIVGILKQNPDAHIPLSDWLNWTSWNAP